MSPSLLVAAVRALASCAPALKDPTAGLLPDVTDVRDISVKIAKAVIQAAVKEDLNQERDIPADEEDLEEWIREQMWDARYRELKYVPEHEATSHAKGEAGIYTVRRAATFSEGSY
jgi:malate dehydrogenase (oxaloacetate-decarboxylating)